MNLNLFERGIAAIAPSWGMRRLSAKVALHEAQLALRHYDAARRDRRTENWIATGGSANAELAPSLDLIRRRSRDLCRNNEWAVNAKRKLVAHMIGMGIMPRPKQDVPERAKQVASDAWDAFVEQCDPEGLTDFYGMQARLVGEVVEGGAAFIRWHLRSPEFGLKVPLQCEVLDHDFLDIRKTEIPRDRPGHVIINGVEYDRYGRRVAYWLYPVHPGDFNVVVRGGSNVLSQRVPASMCDHVFRVDRPGQVTGVPWLAPTMLRLRDLADYEEAELIRKKIEACFTVFVRREGVGMSGVAQAADQSKDSGGRRIEQLKPGLIAYVEGQGDITTAAPSPSSGAAEHTDRQLYAFAAGVGLTFAQASGNLTRVNYSSMREGKLDFWATLDQWQYFMAIPQICRPAWRRVMAAAAGRGLQVSPDLGAEWTPPRRPWVDPKKDLEAEEIELRLGLESWREKVAARGYDPDRLLADIKKERDQLKAAGLAPAATPGQSSATGNGSVNPEDREDEDDERSDRTYQ